MGKLNGKHDENRGENKVVAIGLKAATGGVPEVKVPAGGISFTLCDMP